MTTTNTKQDNIIFMEGKEKGLLALFSQNNFGYLAVGCNTDTDTNGFINPPADSNPKENGFHEIIADNEDDGGDSTYHRVPLNVHSNPIRNEDNGEVTVKFIAELDTDNIIQGLPIDQLAIVDSATANDPSTTFYAAATCDDAFNKSEQLALVFIIEMTI